MRRKEDRTNRILDLLIKEKKLEVAELSAHLGVSQVTVRKDLDAMEALGLIKREHGFAVLSHTDDIKGRLAYHYEEKRKIALRAAELVKDGETIMIESGSCCALLAAALTEIRSDLTMITNSAFIADYIRITKIFGRRHSNQNKTQSVCQFDHPPVDSGEIDTDVKKNQADFPAFRQAFDRRTLEINVVLAIQKAGNSDLASKVFSLFKDIIHQK